MRVILTHFSKVIFKFYDKKRLISNVAVYPKLWWRKKTYFLLIHIYFGSVTLFVFVYCYSFYYFTLAMANNNGGKLIRLLNIWGKNHVFAIQLKAWPLIQKFVWCIWHKMTHMTSIYDGRFGRSWCLKKRLYLSIDTR